MRRVHSVNTSAAGLSVRFFNAMIASGRRVVARSIGKALRNQSLYKKPLYDAITDFAPVMLIAEQPLALITRKDLTAENLQQFMAYAKANQTTMRYGSAGTGSAAHLGCLLLNTAVGIDVTHVPCRGGAGGMQDLIAGLIDYQCPASTLAIPQVEAKSVNAIAILSKDRSPTLPNLASAQEQGLAGFDAGIWYALFLPKDTPKDIIEKLHAATEATLDTAAVQSRMNEIGVSLVAHARRSPEYLAQFVATEIKKWSGPIKASGMMIE